MEKEKIAMEKTMKYEIDMCQSKLILEKNAHKQELKKIENLLLISKTEVLVLIKMH